MTLATFLSDCLRDSRLEGVDIDSPALMDVHRAILMEKPMMRGVFGEFYAACVGLAARYFRPTGQEIEIGAGVSLFKQFHPQIISTDIKPSPQLDRVLDAQAMDVEAGSVRALYGINCFHHLPQPRLFFAELVRVLGAGGGVVLIEPYDSVLGRFLYARMHHSEHFNLAQKNWETELSAGQVMSGANQALSELVFVRDRAVFEREFPQLEIVDIHPLSNWLRYLVSGGVNFRQLLPDFMIGPLKAIEWVLRPLHRLFALHYVIILRRRA